MKRICSLLLVLFVTQAFAQVTHYPLNIGDRWQYFLLDPGSPSVMIEYQVTADTVMPNGNRYAIYAQTQYGSIRVWYPTYQRQVGNRVYLYNPQIGQEYVVYDFARSIGDSLGFYVLNADTFDVFLTNAQTGTFWGTQRRTWSFGHRIRHLTDGSRSTMIVDSLGLYSYALDAEPYYFGGAIVAGQRYGNISAIEHRFLDRHERPQLYQNYPNPFNSSTTFRYVLPKQTEVDLGVYDMLGRRVATLVHASENAGEHSVSFDASLLASGVYLVRMMAENRSLSKRVILLK